MNIRLSMALALVSSVSVFACSADSDGNTPASANEPGSVEEPAAPKAPAAPQGRAGHRFAPSTHVSTAAGTIGAMRVFEATTLTTNAVDGQFAYGTPITVTFANMPTDNEKNWIDFAPVGSAATVYSWDAYTDSIGKSGTVTTYAGDFLPPGIYVARAFANDSYDVLTESAPFTVTGTRPTVATVTLDDPTPENLEDPTAIDGFGRITARFSNATPNATVFVSVHQPHGSMGTAFDGKYVQADANGAGSVQLGDVVAGEFEVRVSENGSWKGTSSKFNVNPAITTNNTTYKVGDAVTVSFAGMQALTVNDSVALALAGSADTAFVGTPVKADWYWSGSRSLSTAGLAPGNYVARIFFDFSTTKKAESVQFTITAQ